MAARKPAAKKVAAKKSIKSSSSAKKNSTRLRDYAQNRRQAAPFGRYEDYSPMRGPKGKPNLPKRPRSK